MPFGKLALARFAVANAQNMCRRQIQTTAVVSSHAHERQTDAVEMANGREYVGYFINGEPIYSDRMDFPYPAIRFRKTSDIKALQEKEKGDWRKLSLQEKKQLYRASFRATFSEFDHPTGYWKIIAAMYFVGLSVSFAIIILFKQFTVMKDLPHLSNEAKEKELQFMIDTYSEPLTGVASKWDYEKNRWKA